VVGLVGIVLLMGIVKKNAIMMVDFAIEARREPGLGTRGRDTRGCAAALPAHHDDDDGGIAWCASAHAGAGGRSELRTPLGVAVVGGLLLSQAVTLYTTPGHLPRMESVREALTRRRAAAPAE